MRKFFLQGILAFVCVHVSQAQWFGPYGTELQVPGQIVRNDGTISNTKLEVVAVFSGFSAEYMQNKVRYFDNNGTRKKLRPTEAKEVRFNWKDQEVRMISRKAIHHTNKLRFMHLLVDGNVRLYEYIKTYRYSGRGGMSTARIRTAIYWYLEREDGTVITPHSIGFRKQMRAFFADCPALVDRINYKVYKLWEVPAMVSFYNDECRR